MKTNNGSMGGIKFLIQYSFQQRQFVSIGFDLLPSLGACELHHITENVVFRHNADTLDAVPTTSTSGSPRVEVPDLNHEYQSAISRRLDFVRFYGVDESTDFNNLCIFS